MMEEVHRDLHKRTARYTPRVSESSLLTRLLALVSLLPAASAHAGGQPGVRSVTSDAGMVLGEVHALAQDDRGTLWIGGWSGVYHWDGRSAVRSDGGRVRDAPREIEITQDGSVFARGYGTGQVWRIAGERTELLRGPRGEPIVAAGIDVDPLGRLLVLHDGALMRLRDSHWEFLAENDLFRRMDSLFVLEDGGLVLSSRSASWFMSDPTASPTRWGELRFGWQHARLEAADGTLWFGDRNGTLTHARPDGVVLARTRPEVGGINDVVQDSRGTLWIGGNQGLYAIYGDGSTERIVGREVRAGGALLVDREDSLWLGSYDGLSIIGIPEIRTWSTEQGLSADIGRSVHADHDDVYLTTWKMPGWIDRSTGQARSLEVVDNAKSHVCTDGTGLLWVSAGRGRGLGGALRGGWVRGLRDGVVVRDLPAELPYSYIEGCHSDDRGVAWMTVGQEIWGLRGDDAPLIVPAPFGEDRRGDGRSVYIDGGVLYVSVANRVCESALDAARAGAPSWSCSEIPRGLWVSRLHRTEAGRLWAGSARGLFVRSADGAWSEVPGLARHSSHILTALAPASAGGFWVGGQSLLLRVRDRPDHPDGYEVIQDLSGWVGSRVATFRDVIEDDEGTLWIAHPDGITAVPRQAQHPDRSPPPVFVQEARIDGRPAEDPSEKLLFPTSGSVLRARVSAPSYRMPALLRFRSRIDDRPWSDPVVDGIFELQGLRTGDHELQISASMDGVRWSDPPARIRVSVPVSWYARVELWALLLAVLGGAVLAYQQTRARFALRVERLRTRIALDLHDEVGAGLGAIGLLGSVLERDLPKAAVKSVGSDIAETSRELSEGLRAIVWSMRPSSRSLDELGAYLADRARMSLTGIHEAGGLEVDIDRAAAGVDLPLEVLRAAQLIGLEALHNVAKHARARRVRLGVDRVGRAWRIVVEDDGVGIDPDRPPSVDGGNGLVSMGARAAEVGARLHLDSRPGQGTRVVLWLPRGRAWLVNQRGEP